MANLTRSDVLKLAQLAQIQLTDSEVEEFSSELSNILEYVKKLQAVDVSGLEATSQVTGLVNVMREDKIRDYGYKPKDLLKNVPHVTSDQIKVKRMLE